VELYLHFTKNFSWCSALLSSGTTTFTFPRFWSGAPALGLEPRNDYILNCLHLETIIRWPFAKFVDSPYHSESELCGGAVTVSFSKYLPWQAMHFLQRFTHFSETCCRPMITSKCLASEFPFHEARSGLYDGCSNGVPPIHFFQAEHRIQFRSRPMRFLGFSNHEKRAPGQEISK
jgi:hypothetical protein